MESNIDEFKMQLKWNAKKVSNILVQYFLHCHFCPNEMHQ